jgi:hypothetical protein
MYRSESVQLKPNPRYGLPQEKVSTGTIDDKSVWFCSKFQRNKCSLKSAHVVTSKGGKTRFAKHICATCWDLDKKELPHPECSSACPHANQ